MEPTQSSETSAFNTQTPGNYPEDNLSFLMYSPKVFKIPPPQKATLQTQHFINFLLNFITIGWWERILFLLNAAFVMSVETQVEEKKTGSADIKTIICFNIHGSVHRNNIIIQGYVIGFPLGVSPASES
jgi:hypothetical protein